MAKREWTLDEIREIVSQMREKYEDISRFNVGDRAACKALMAFRTDEPFKIVSIGYTWMGPEVGRRFQYIVQYEEDDRLDAIPVGSEASYQMEKVPEWYKGPAK